MKQKSEGDCSIDDSGVLCRVYTRRFDNQILKGKLTKKNFLVVKLAQYFLCEIVRLRSWLSKPLSVNAALISLNYTALFALLHSVLEQCTLRLSSKLLYPSRIIENGKFKRIIRFKTRIEKRRIFIMKHDNIPIPICKSRKNTDLSRVILEPRSLLLCLLQEYHMPRLHKQV